MRTCATACSEIEKVVVAQRDAVEYLLAAAVVGGHVLLEGPPGVAKTLLANATARALRVDFRRLQFTPDMLPSDVTGTMALRASELVFRPGPIFTNVLLADEINRARRRRRSRRCSRRCRSGRSRSTAFRTLCRHRSSSSRRRTRSSTKDLPAAGGWLDRFLFKVVIAYLDERDEREMLALAHRGLAPASLADVAPVAGPDELAAAAAAVDETSVTDEVAAYVVAIVRQTRTLPSVELGASPRAAVHLSAAAKAAAQLAGRGFVTPDDVAGMAPAVLRHRLVMRPEAELERFTADDAVRAALEAVPVPR